MPDYVRTLDTLEMVGGALCLDFVNTINSRIAPEHDYLRSYADLVGWSARAGILSADDASRLVATAEAVDFAMEEALSLRALLYLIFSTLARHADPDPAEMALFVAHYAETIGRSDFVRVDTAYMPVWDVHYREDALLNPILYSAGNLLMSPALAHLKECPGCGWLFVDTSKNQSRRWCSMNTCGARSKMRRYRTADS